MLLLCLLSVARTATAESDSQEMLKSLKRLLNSSLTAQKETADLAIKEIRDVTEGFKNFVQTLPLKSISCDFNYKKAMDRLDNKLFELNFYLKLLVENLIPKEKVSEELESEIQKLKDQLKDIKMKEVE